MKRGLEPSTQAVPKSNATNANFTKNKQFTVISGCKLRGDVDNGFTNCIVFWIGKSHMMSIVNDGLPKTLIKALPYGTVWVDECSPFVVPGVANILGTNGTSIGLGFF